MFKRVLQNVTHSGVKTCFLKTEKRKNVDVLSVVIKCKC